MKYGTHFVLAVVIASATGCASKQPSPELIDARAAYSRAQVGPAAQANPAGLYEAKKSLDAAEAKFKDDASSDEAKNLAYVAHRKTLLAEANGRAAVAAGQQQQGEQALQQIRANQLTAAKGTVQTQQQMLDSERQARMQEMQARQQAEHRAKEALDCLQNFAAVKSDARGMVITLSGSVLFQTNKTDLMGTAKERLNQVGDALKEVEGRSITIVGHTDSVGADDYNRELSMKRAEAVRGYLVSRGVRPDLVKAEGRGEAEPVASNDSTEGRANNRRVEIIVDNGGGTTAPSTGSPEPSTSPATKP